MNCPKCGSKETYRKRPDSMLIHCDQCAHQWEAKQVQKAFMSAKVWQKIDRINLRVSVWLCPKDKNKYSFSIGAPGGGMIFDEFPEDRFLSGCYDSIGEALAAGIKEAESE